MNDRPALRAAILCDAASVREGLLHILGGGVTRLWRNELPAPLGCALAFIIEFPESLGARPHQLHVRVIHEGQPRAVLADLNAAVVIGENPRREKGEPYIWPVAIPMFPLGIEQYGQHTVEVTVDAEPMQQAMTFWVLHPDEQQLPPL